VFTGPIFGWDRKGDKIVPNWREQGIIDYIRHRHYVQGWSGNATNALYASNKVEEELIKLGVRPSRFRANH